MTENTIDSSLPLSALLARSYQEIKNRFTAFFILASITPCINLLLSTLFGFSFSLSDAASPTKFFLFSAYLLLIFFVSQWTTIALILFVCKRVQTISEAFFVAISRIPRLLGGICLCGLLFILIAILTGVIVFLLLWVQNTLTTLLATLTFISAAIFYVVFSVYIILVIYPLILTDCPITDAFRLSYILVKNQFWNTVGLLLILTLIMAILMIMSNIVLGFLTLLFPQFKVFLLILEIIPNALSILIYQIPLIALYIDRSTALQQKIRQETDHPSPAKQPVQTDL